MNKHEELKPTSDNKSPIETATAGSSSAARNELGSSLASVASPNLDSHHPVPDFANLLPLPPIAFGTHMLQDDAAEKGVYDALMAGYRCIDTASRYFNEKEVGKAITRSGIDRNSIFLITKIGPQDTKKGREAIVKSFKESLANLNTSYIDCYLMHWPGVGGLAPEDPKNISKRVEAWQVMLDLKKEGLARYVGVSNYKVRHFESLKAAGLALPDIHQTELHPLCKQSETIDYCRAHRILIQQYSPLAKADHHLFEHDAMLTAVAQLEEKLKDQKPTPVTVTPAMLCLMWGRYKGYDSAAVRSTDPTRIAANLSAILFYDTLVAPYADRVGILAELDAALANEADLHTCWESSKVA